jgi:hypothetical protein
MRIICTVALHYSTVEKDEAKWRTGINSLLKTLHCNAGFLREDSFRQLDETYCFYDEK